MGQPVNSKAVGVDWRSVSLTVSYVELGVEWSTYKEAQRKETDDNKGKGGAYDNHTFEHPEMQGK